MSMESTQYFTISVDEGHDSDQGLYCSYCGKRITPVSEDGRFVFTCDCDLAQHEAALREDLSNAENILGLFLEAQEKKVRESELTTRIRVLEAHTESLKKTLAELNNPKTD